MSFDEETIIDILTQRDKGRPAIVRKSDENSKISQTDAKERAKMRKGGRRRSGLRTFAAETDKGETDASTDGMRS